MTAAVSTLRLLLPSGRALRLLDTLLVFWVLAWALLGVAVHNEVRGLRQLSDTVVKVGTAVERTGHTLAELGAVPIVGTQIGDTAQSVVDAGRETVRSGSASRQSVRSLAWMLGIAIAVIPSLPIVGFYIPLRLRLVRERRSLAALVRAHGEDIEFRRYLAHRALFTLPHTRLLEQSGRPWHDYLEGDLDDLAEMELRRLGLGQRSDLET